MIPKLLKIELLTLFSSQVFQGVFYLQGFKKVPHLDSVISSGQHLHDMKSLMLLFKAFSLGSKVGLDSIQRIAKSFLSYLRIHWAAFIKKDSSLISIESFEEIIEPICPKPQLETDTRRNEIVKVITSSHHPAGDLEELLLPTLLFNSLTSVKTILADVGVLYNKGLIARDQLVEVVNGAKIGSEQLAEYFADQFREKYSRENYLSYQKAGNELIRLVKEKQFSEGLMTIIKSMDKDRLQNLSNNLFNKTCHMRGEYNEEFFKEIEKEISEEIEKEISGVISVERARMLTRVFKNQLNAPQQDGGVGLRQITDDLAQAVFSLEEIVGNWTRIMIDWDKHPNKTDIAKLFDLLPSSFKTISFSEFSRQIIELYYAELTSGAIIEHLSEEVFNLQALPNIEDIVAKANEANSALKKLSLDLENIITSDNFQENLGNNIITAIKESGLVNFKEKDSTILASKLDLLATGPYTEFFIRYKINELLEVIFQANLASFTNELQSALNKADKLISSFKDAIDDHQSEAQRIDKLRTIMGDAFSEETTNEFIINLVSKAKEANLYEIGEESIVENFESFITKFSHLSKTINPKKIITNQASNLLVNIAWTIIFNRFLPSPISYMGHMSFAILHIVNNLVIVSMCYNAAREMSDQNYDIKLHALYLLYSVQGLGYNIGEVIKKFKSIGVQLDAIASTYGYLFPGYFSLSVETTLTSVAGGGMLCLGAYASKIVFSKICEAYLISSEQNNENDQSPSQHLNSALIA
jgi:hypothetical protein